MEKNTLSIRPFIGAKDFKKSRSFYRDIGFEETVLMPHISVFKMDDLAFYLQDAYVKDWVDNTMVFIEVKDVAAFWEKLVSLDLAASYPEARLVPIRTEQWGRECFLHDPSGILWHFGEFF